MTTGQHHLHRHAGVEAAGRDAAKGRSHQVAAVTVNGLKPRVVHVGDDGKGGYAGRIALDTGDDVAEAVNRVRQPHLVEQTGNSGRHSAFMVGNRRLRSQAGEDAEGAVFVNGHGNYSPGNSILYGVARL